MHKTLPVELRILLTCAHRNFDAEAQAAVAALVDQGVDWEALLSSSRLHGLMPLLHGRLSALDAATIPPQVMARLKSAYYTSLLRNQRLGVELAEVIAALRHEGVEAIVLKGAALSRTVYPDPAQRPMVDLDLLARLGGADRAAMVLTFLGFGLSTSIPASLVPFHQRFGGGLEWVRFTAGQTTHLDVHHDLVGLDWCWAAFPVEQDALWADARPLALDGIPAWQLSPEDTLIHLCLHPALHHGYACPLIGYVDIDRVITGADGDLSWARLIERAGQFQLKAVVYYGLQCAQDLLGTPVPPEVLVALRPGSLRLRLLSRLASLDPEVVLQRAGRQPSGVKQVVLYATMADPIGAGAGMARRLLFPGEEWLITRYGLGSQRQAGLYRLVHPLRLARSFLRGLQRPLIESGLD